MQRPITTIILAFIGPLILLASAAANIEYSVEFAPSTVQVGQTASYTLHLHGIKDQPSVPRPPHTPGLHWSGSNHQMHYQMQGGKVQQQLTLGFYTRPTEPGTYTVPAWELLVDGQTLKIPAVTLTVQEATATNLPSNPSSEQRTVSLEEAVFLRINHLPSSLYIGEAVEARIELYLLESLVELDFSKPTQKGSDFIVIGQNDQPSQRQAEKDGLHYKVFSWPVALSPLKTGVTEIAYEMTITIGIPRQRSHPQSPFDSSLFDRMRRMLGGNLEQRQLTVQSTPVSVQINELPAEGRPESFNGAVGNFSLEKATISEDQLAVGEPTSLLYTITGEGNLARIQPPALEAPHWRSLSPRSEFIADSALNLSGRKSLSYTLLPQSAEVTHTPPLEFSYFEPRSGQYHTIEVQGFAVAVSPGLSSMAYDPKEETVQPASQRQEPRLLPLRNESGRTVKAILPLFHSPLFLAAQTVPLALLIGAFMYCKRHHRCHSDPVYARKVRLNRSLRRHLKLARSTNSNEAYEHWLLALRVSLSMHLPTAEPEALTRQDIEPIIATFDPQQQELIINIFTQAEQMRYGGGSQPDYDPQVLQQLISHIQRTAP